MSSVGGVGRTGGADFGSAAGAGAGPSATAWTPSSPLLAGPELAAVARGEAEIAKGARGEGVRKLQQALIRAGKLPAGGADGAFGPGTERALAAFQRESGLTASGRLDRATLEALDRKLGGGTERTSALPAPDPLRKAAASYLSTPTERDAYEFAKRKLFTGTSWRYGIDLAVTDEDTLAVLDRLETLPAKSYNAVLHALAATRESDPWSPTLLDKLVVRGTSQFGNAALSSRFSEQLERKLRPLGATPQNKILRHISPDSVARLEGWTGWSRLKALIG